ncbi:MAG TPA: response regulator, partial [Clostridia bacterium]|nr:response regulator [Clostridia bacterium]
MLRKILIVDDEKFIRHGLKAMIEHFGTYDVALARNGQEAMAHIDENRVDMVFTDVSMPFMDGIALIRALQQVSPKPVVVIISGYNDFNYAVEGLRNGVADYLLKPIDREDVRALLERYAHHGDNPEAGKDYDIELLVRDLKCAVLNAETTIGQERELLARIRAKMGEPSFFLLCLRTNSVFLHTTLSDELNRLYPGRALLADQVGRWDYLIAPEIPPFLNQAQGKWACLSGAVEVSEETEQRLFTLCQLARESAKHAFLLGQPLLRYDPDSVRERPNPEVSRLLVMLGTGKMEAFRSEVLDTWEPQARRSVHCSALEQFIKGFTQGAAEFYPAVYGRFRTLADKLCDPYVFSSWEAFVQEFLGFAYLMANGVREQGHGRYSQPLRAALAYIEEHYAKDINLAMVANHVSVNYSVLSKEFKEQVGVNFVNYLKKRRIDEAKRLLVETDRRSGEIG